MFPLTGLFTREWGMKRSTKGATLVLIIACIVSIVLLGVCFFFVLHLFGAVRQAQNAADAGNLNLVKQVLRHPSVRPGVNSRDFIVLTDLGDSGAGFQGEINLMTYNRLVGAAAICAQNAAAEGTQGAFDHVTALIGELNQRGAALRDALVNGANNSALGAYDLQGQFNKVSDKQNINKAGNNQGQLARTGYQAGYYVDAYRPTNILLDDMPTGVNLDTFTAPALPGNLTVNNPKDGNKPYMAGYTDLNFNIPGKGVVKLCGVPTYPADVPHLISQSDFNTDPSSLTSVAAANLPTNAYHDLAQLNADSTWNNNGDTTAKGARVESIAVIGTVDRNQIYKPSLPKGYLIIDNRGQGAATGYTPTGTSVLAGELSTGIFVYGGANPNAVFSTDNTPGSPFDQWRNFDRQGQPPPATPPSNLPPTTGIYNANGDPATWQECWNNIPQTPSGGSAIPPTQCTDMNTTAPPCSTLIDPRSGQSQGAFDLAYHRGQNLGGNNGAPNSLTAVEVAKCKVWEAYYVPPFSQCVSNVCGPYFNSIGSTGLRLFPENVNDPGNGVTVVPPWRGGIVRYGYPGAGFAQVPGNSYSQAQACQVTTNGTLAQLINQSFGAGLGNPAPFYAKDNAGLVQGAAPQNPVQVVTTLIANRIKQINPGTAAEINAATTAVMNTPLPLGTVLYVHLDNSGNITCDQGVAGTPFTDPSEFDTNIKPDGHLRRYVVKYDLTDSVANSHMDNNIHDHHFMSQIPVNTLFGFNTLAVHSSTGAKNGCLGVLRLQNDAGCEQFPPYNATTSVPDNGLNAITTTPSGGDFSLCNRD